MDYTIFLKLIDENCLDEALSQLDTLISANPIDDEAYYLKGKIYQRQARWGEAIITYQKAIDINPESKAVVALEMLYDILNSLNNKIITT